MGWAAVNFGAGVFCIGFYLAASGLALLWEGRWGGIGLVLLGLPMIIGGAYCAFSIANQMEKERDRMTR